MTAAAYPDTVFRFRFVLAEDGTVEVWLDLGTTSEESDVRGWLPRGSLVETGPTKLSGERACAVLRQLEQAIELLAAEETLPVQSDERAPEALPASPVDATPQLLSARRG